MNNGITFISDISSSYFYYILTVISPRDLCTTLVCTNTRATSATFVAGEMSLMRTRLYMPFTDVLTLEIKEQMAINTVLTCAFFKEWINFYSLWMRLIF